MNIKKEISLKKGVIFVSRYCVIVFLISMIAIAGSEVTAFGQGFIFEESDWTGNANFFLGAKTLNGDEWEPADKQEEFGIEVDFKPQSWSVSIALELLSGSGEGTSGGYDFESKTSEINFGVRTIWDQFQRMRPFVGGGISIIRGELSANRTSEARIGFGLWLCGGIYWTLADHYNIGLEVKFSSAEINLFDVDFNAGGGHFGLLIGYHW